MSIRLTIKHLLAIKRIKKILREFPGNLCWITPSIIIIPMAIYYTGYYIGYSIGEDDFKQFCEDDISGGRVVCCAMGFITCFILFMIYACSRGYIGDNYPNPIQVVKIYLVICIALIVVIHIIHTTGYYFMMIFNLHIDKIFHESEQHLTFEQDCVQNKGDCRINSFSFGMILCISILIIYCCLKLAIINCYRHIKEAERDGLIETKMEEGKLG